MEGELEAWKEAHKHLTHAVLAAQEGVNAARAQRRFWMEEICANLTPEGKLVATSVWKRPTATKASRKAPKKSAKTDNKGAKRTKKKKTPEGEDGKPKPKKPKTGGKRKKKATEDDMDDADTTEGDSPPLKKTKIRLSLKKPGTKPKKTTKHPKKKTDNSEDEETASPSTEQEGITPSYADWSAAKQSAMPPPHPSATPSLGTSQLPATSLSSTDQYAMMHNVPAELLPFLSPQAGGADTTMTPQPTAPAQPALQTTASYPSAYASFAHASSDDDTSVEE